MPKFIDLSDKTFGHWTVISRGDTTDSGQIKWECRCSCGAIQMCQGGHLRSGRSTMCKTCSNRIKAAGTVTHGMSRRAIYSTWYGMLQRCRDPDNLSFAYYGGRGITVCERWHDFSCFYEDMGDRPEGCSLDRKDNDGPYCKENCEWASRKTQMRNTRQNCHITFRGETKTQAEWAEITGISQRTISERLLSGWDVDAALTRPPGLGKRKRR